MALFNIDIKSAHLSLVIDSSVKGYNLTLPFLPQANRQVFSAHIRSASPASISVLYAPFRSIFKFRGYFFSGGR
jgi:hypothetical protein